MTPPLRNGDHLDREEFHRRYLTMPEVKKAELIEGIVYMPSPVPLVGHGKEHGHLVGWLGFDSTHTPGARGGVSSSVFLDRVNEPQPDAVLILDPELGGRTRLDNGFLVGGPELVAEVAYSRASIERHAKLHAYRRNGVQEYVVWRTEDREIDWFALSEGQYRPLPVVDGVVRSQVFAGLWLDVEAMLAHDLLRVMAVEKQGLAALQPPAVP